MKPADVYAALSENSSYSSDYPGDVTVVRSTFVLSTYSMCVSTSVASV